MIGSLRLLPGVALLLSSAALTSPSGQQPAGVAGLPVEGHRIIAVFEIQGSKHFNSKRAEDRFPAEGINIRTGRPIEGGTICRIKEVVRDVMAEKGFPNAGVTHDLESLPPQRFGPNASRLTIRISEGQRSTAGKSTGSGTLLLTPSQRCDR